MININTNILEKYNANDTDAVLNFLHENDIVDISYMRNLMEMKYREQILNDHPARVWQASDGYWKTYLTDENNQRKLVKRKVKKELEYVIVSYYKKKKDFTFSVYFEEWKEKQKKYGVSNNTLLKYNSDYKRFFKDSDFEKMDIRKINEEDITAFMIQVIKKLNLKEKAGNSLWGYISGTFKHARIKRIISENPCDYVEKKNFMRFYNRNRKSIEQRTVCNNDLDALLQELHRSQTEKPQYIPSYAVELAIYTGMRVGELAALKWGNIKYDKDYILIDSSEKYDRVEKKWNIESTKTGKERQFPLSDEITNLLNRVKKVELKEGYIGEYVFMNENGRVNARSISHCVRYRCKKAGINEKSIHALRRTFNSRMRLAGVPPVIAASLLGHSEQINESNYTYDISGMEYKKQIISKINRIASAN